MIKIIRNLSPDQSKVLAGQISRFLSSSLSYEELNKLKSPRSARDFKGGNLAFIAFWLPRIEKAGIKRYKQILAVKGQVAKLDPSVSQRSIELLERRLSFEEPSFNSITQTGVSGYAALTRILALNVGGDSESKNIIGREISVGLANPLYKNLLRKGILSKRVNLAFFEDNSKFNVWDYVRYGTPLTLTSWGGSVNEFQYVQFLKLLNMNNPDYAVKFNRIIIDYFRSSLRSSSLISKVLSSKNKNGESLWELMIGSQYDSELDERFMGAEGFSALIKVFSDFVEEVGNKSEVIRMNRAISKEVG